jgi:hypothetical protein
MLTTGPAAGALEIEPRHGRDLRGLTAVAVPRDRLAVNRPGNSLGVRSGGRSPLTSGPHGVLSGPMLSHVRNCPDSSTILKMCSPGEAQQHVHSVLN